MIKYFDSGIYSREVFYIKHEINFSSNDISYEDISYDSELLAQLYEEHYDFVYDRESDRWEHVEAEVWDKLCLYNIHYEPIVFDEEIALKCGLTPFTYRGINLLALSGCGMDLTPRLEAYQALVHSTIDKCSKLLTENGRKYFEQVVGKDITQRVLETISNSEESQ